MFVGLLELSVPLQQAALQLTAFLPLLLLLPPLGGVPLCFLGAAADADDDEEAAALSASSFAIVREYDLSRR